MKLLLVFTLLISTNVFAKTPKILFMINEGFYGDEYYFPLKIFKANGFVVKTAAKSKDPIAVDQRQRAIYPAVIPDLAFSDVRSSDYDAIVFAGGNGAWEDYFPNETVHKILKAFMDEGKITALLCSSTGLLGLAGNLNGSGTALAKGRNVTGYFRVEGILKVMGKVNYHPGETGKPFVMVDQQLVTGRDPLSAELFANTVVEELSKQ